MSRDTREAHPVGGHGGRMRADGDSLRQRIVRAIERYHDERDQWPTYREIGEKVGIEAPSHVKHHVAMLVKQGILTHQPGISRGISLARREDASPQPDRLRVLIRGRIAAHEPLDLFDQGEAEELDLGLARFEIASALAGEEVYALLVDGDSMIEDGILDGDYVLVRAGVGVPNGAIAVVVENRANGGHGAATLKHFFKEDAQIRLQPANPAHPPIIIAPADWNRDWRIQGTAIGVYRRLGGKR